MNDVSIFRHKQFGEIRTTGTPGNPLFCLNDICKVLELDQPSRVKSRLKDDGVTQIKVIDKLGREQQATFVNEQNLYRVIMRSDKPQAEAFQDWVCGEVLPSIRKHGAYATEATIDSIIADPDSGIRLLKALKEERAQRRLSESQVSLLEEVTREQGLFELKKNSHSENGVMKTTVTPKVTGKGQQYFINKFINK